jgi:hypothetical protein
MPVRRYFFRHRVSVKTLSTPIDSDCSDTSGHLEHKLLTESPMSAEQHSDEKNLHVKVRSTDLDAPMLVDQIDAELLDHLIVCRSCFLVFVDQECSLGEAGCIEGIRIVSQSKVRWQERRLNLALQHLTEQTLDDYVFDRLTSDERQSIEHHIKCCSQCAEEIRQRDTLVTLIKAALSERRADSNTSSSATGVVQVRVSTRAFSVLKEQVEKRLVMR